MRHRHPALLPLAIAVALILILAGSALVLRHQPGPPTPKPTPPAGSDFHLLNVTDELGATFVEGAPQAFGWNGSAVLVTGVVGAPGIATIPFPLLGELGGVPGNPIPANLSAQVTSLFHGGDTLGVAWNGSAWLISGEASWGDFTTGAAAFLSGGSWTNLTPLIGPFFSGTGGVWFDGWNGSSWLLGGNSSSGAALVAIQGSTIRNLTGLIPNNGPNAWIQFVSWNGSAWLVGGQGVFGAIEGDRYTDLYPDSEFTRGGMFAADWNGSAWLVGGGSPGSVEFLKGLTLIAGPALPASFTWWVSGIVWDGKGWYIGGEGSSAGHPVDAALDYLDAATQTLVDLSPGLPKAFSGGQVEFAAVAPWSGPTAVLLIGQGDLGPKSPGGGPSHGAAGIVTRLS